MGQIPQKDGWQFSTALTHLDMETAGVQSFSLPMYVICMFLLLIYISAWCAIFSCLLIITHSNIPRWQHELLESSVFSLVTWRNLEEERMFHLQEHVVKAQGWESNRAAWILPPFCSYYLKVICGASLNFTFLFCKEWNNKIDLWDNC